MTEEKLLLPSLKVIGRKNMNLQSRCSTNQPCQSIICHLCLKIVSHQAFCFIDIGVHHASSPAPASVVRKIKLEPEETSIPQERKIEEKQQPTPKGPYECTFAGCDYVTDSVVHFGKHWNVKHPEDPSKAVFKDQKTGRMLDLFMIFNCIMQCKLCR